MYERFLLDHGHYHDRVKWVITHLQTQLSLDDTNV